MDISLISIDIKTESWAKAPCLDPRVSNSWFSLILYDAFLFQQRSDALIDLRQREEAVVTQARQDPPFDDLHTHFGFGFILVMDLSP